MRFGIALCILASLALSSVASATTWGESDTFYIIANFTGQAFGKPVAGVYIHTGILKTPSSCSYGFNGPFWDGTQHVKMDKVGNHFFGKVKITTGTSECAPSIKGPMIQYWVYFEDGTEMKTEPTEVPTTQTHLGSEEYKSKLADMDAAFEKYNDAMGTFAQRLTYGYAD